MDGDCFYPKRLYETGDQTNVASNGMFQRGAWLDFGASLKCFVLLIFFLIKRKRFVWCWWALGTAVLTTFIVLGDAPWFVSWVTMFSWPIKAATWIGVSPDCQRQKYAALKHWELHAKANITSFQNAHVVFQNNSISDWNTLHLTIVTCFIAMYENPYLPQIKDKPSWEIKLQLWDMVYKVAFTRNSHNELETTARFKATIPDIKSLCEFKVEIIRN